ncbi:MAG: mevalonate kinase [Thermoplasmata archaeon]|nr:mevalonate kinase [Thermoplasmata archaeon]
MRYMATGSGFGKAILFGEHFVVYGNASIASGISKKTEVILVEGTEPGFKIIDKRPAAEGYIEKYAEAQRESVELMNKAVWHLDFDKTPVEVTIAGDLYCASGVGASAASCVAMARAVSEHFDLNLSEEEINKCGLEGDKAYAGTPSGIDNTCSTYGGLIFFRKNLDGGENQMDQLTLGKPLNILLVSTGITTKTKLAVDGVRERKEQDPEEYEIVFEEAEKVVIQAKDALAEGNLIKVGQLMDENHELLQEIRVSHPELDHLVDLTRDNDALGAKMTGGGMGGYMIALFADAETQEEAARVCESEGYKVIRARIGN